MQCEEFCVFFVLPKGQMVQWGMGFSEVWGVTICCCYITAGFLSAGISNEGSAFFLCLPEPEIGRCFSDEVRSE